MLVVSSYGLTHPGRVREHNEDALVADDRLRLYGVADGLGGLLAGEVASRVALHELQQFVHSHARAAASEREGLLEKAFGRINQHIIRLGHQREDHRGMSTTITACWISAETAHFMHAGDSAAFLVRGSKIKKVSRDHTLMAAMSDGIIFRPRSSPRAWDHILTRCLGYRLDDRPDTMNVRLKINDLLLLCTDGLLRQVDLTEVRQIIESASDLAGIAKKLVELANEKGGQDNMTVVLVKMLRWAD